MRFSHFEWRVLYSSAVRAGAAVREFWRKTEVEPKFFDHPLPKHAVRMGGAPKGVEAIAKVEDANSFRNTSVMRER